MDHQRYTMAKTRVWVFVALLIFLLFIGKKTRNPFPREDFHGRGIYVYNLSDGKVVFAKGEDEKIAPASLTKIMTVLLALEEGLDLDEITPVDKESYQEMVAENSSMAGFYGNEPTTFQDLLYGTLLTSGGECARSLAIHCRGNLNSFIEGMNEKAKELAMENTYFTTVEGLDMEGQYSTAKDMGILLKNALQNQDFERIFTKDEYLSTATPSHPEGIPIRSTVLSKISPEEQKGFEILGGKSGTTPLNGKSWAVLAEKNNKRYLIISYGAFGNGEPQKEDVLQILERL
ncbi:MAG: D-alanyl-D-alanine carboxypeptidase [Tissierellia bacterium]|nr:D-alanyl-D-alanine carboxypeptidase [Tissierellia bacterium]